MFIDSQGKINKLLSRYRRTYRPYIVIRKDNVLHRIWRMSDKRKIAMIQSLLKGKQIFIADGHHRYEAALNYKMQKQGKRKQSKRLSPFNYVMTYLVATADPGLAILPTHRVVRIKANFKFPEIIANLRKTFEVHWFTTSDKLFSYMHKSRLGPCIFGAYFGKNKFCGLKLKKAKDLDVAILHSVIIEQTLDLVPFEEDIYYTRDAQEAIKLVDEGKYQMSFFLRPLRITQVKKMAKAKEKMPHKSTYFYPKLLTGLVINKF